MDKKKTVIIIVAVVVAVLLVIGIALAAIGVIGGIAVTKVIDEQSANTELRDFYEFKPEVGVSQLTNMKGDIKNDLGIVVKEIASTSDDTFIIETEELNPKESRELLDYLEEKYLADRKEIRFNRVEALKDSNVKEGTLIVFTPELNDDEKLSELDTDEVVGILKKRLSNSEFKETTIEIQNDYCIRVEAPSGDDIYEFSSLFSLGDLQFIDTYGNVLLEGDRRVIESAEMIKKDGYYAVEINFTKEGREAFKKATETVIEQKAEGNNYLCICLDGSIISAPMVEEVIDNDKCIISGNFSKKDARVLADIINAGELPYSFNASEERYIEYID